MSLLAPPGRRSEGSTPIALLRRRSNRSAQVGCASPVPHVGGRDGVATLSPCAGGAVPVGLKWRIKYFIHQRSFCRLPCLLTPFPPPSPSLSGGGAGGRPLRA